MEIVVILGLTLLNGFFSLSEIALVSVKKSRIEHLASRGDSRAKTILQLLENPENFLSSVQVGITLIGIVSGAYGGAALTDDLERLLVEVDWFLPYAHNIALITVIGSITYFTIVIGELVPKTLAMNNPEGIALVCVPIIRYFTFLTFPFVKLLSISTKLILKLVGMKESDSDHVSEEELKFLIKSAGKQGVLEKEESDVHHNLFYFTDQTAKTLMTHHTDVEWIDINKPTEEIFQQLKDSVHSKFVVADKSLNQILGVLTIKTFLENFNRPDFALNQIIEKPIFVIENAPAFKILNLFKQKKQYIAVVIDEYGSVEGIVTLHDLIEAIVGDLPDEDEADDEYIIPRKDGSYLLDGKTLIYELNQYFKREIIAENTALYTTISGFLIEELQAMPNVGDVIETEKYTFEVLDMDHLRIDKVLLTIR